MRNGAKWLATSMYEGTDVLAQDLHKLLAWRTLKSYPQARRVEAEMCLLNSVEDEANDRHGHSVWG